MIAIIGCGNANRSDDGVGPRVISDLRARGVEGDDVKAYDAGTDGMAAMFSARGCSTLIIVDACRSGSTPGAVFEVPGEEVETTYRPSLTLHDFRWDHALHAGRILFHDDFPAQVTVLLIEAQTVDFGIGLSPAVAGAAARVVERIEALIAADAHGDGKDR